MNSNDKTVEATRLLFSVMKLLKHNMARHYEDHGITLPQGMVIGTLARAGKMKVSDLSSRLSLSNSTVSGIIDRLERQCILERTRSEEDRRIVYVSLSPKFEEIHKDFHKESEMKIKELIGMASPEEMNTIIDGLTIFKKLLSGQQKLDESQ